MIFPEGLQSEEEFSLFAEACPGLLLANMTEFGKTPHITASQFEAMGYDLVIYPVTMQRIAMGAITTCLEELKKEESVQALEEKMQKRKPIFWQVNNQKIKRKNTEKKRTKTEN